MDLESMWSVFLSKIEIKLKPVLFQTWFQETKLIDLNNEYAIVEVPLDVHKKHLQENYGEIIKETFMEVTGSNFKFKYVTKEELEEDNPQIKVNDNNEAIFESGLDSKYTFDNFVSLFDNAVIHFFCFADNFASILINFICIINYNE